MLNLAEQHASRTRHLVQVTLMLFVTLGTLAFALLLPVQAAPLAQAATPTPGAMAHEGMKQEGMMGGEMMGGDMMGGEMSMAEMGAMMDEMMAKMEKMMASMPMSGTMPMEGMMPMAEMGQMMQMMGMMQQHMAHMQMMMGMMMKDPMMCKSMMGEGAMCEGMMQDGMMKEGMMGEGMGKGNAPQGTPEATPEATTPDAPAATATVTATATLTATAEPQAASQPTGHPDHPLVIAPQSATAGAITVEATPLSDDEILDIIFAITLDTHSVPLDFDLAQLATLKIGDASFAATSWTPDAPGGHHVAGTLSFTIDHPAHAALMEVGEVTLELHNIDGQHVELHFAVAEP